MTTDDRRIQRSYMFQSPFIYERMVWIMGNARKIYTSQASLCALGCYLTRQQAFDDLMSLPLPQKKGLTCPLGKIARHADVDLGGGNCDESAWDSHLSRSCCSVRVWPRPLCPFKWNPTAVNGLYRGARWTLEAWKPTIISTAWASAVP